MSLLRKTLALGSAVALLAVAATATSHEDAAKAGKGGSAQLHEIMMNGMPSMTMSGDVDKDFATMMIAHHRQAIALAEVEIRDGHNPELQAMAKKMNEQQKREIADLERLAKTH
ncbi:MAG: hypothetical protein BGP24_09735 [Lysobacterales bacterium 69-70]|nr:DUF305 domain-containing protein [Xanthomonadaceae bacterium]ODU33235.1 MAG: hypothetical protein ABS97_12760 [Xanthomonadaceae bacterium SCN 69-320]ODV20439.1 MAG: hypothetical protein ABT27_06910 [Xanthomonadaceae bacterium SCN 69-25]OJZ00779.1 MAG: hypothetical protein BGP24_09735 [Xanthomonadales bacterium 69-70]